MNADASAPRPPAILVVSADDRQRSALVDPLNRRYAQDYRIIDADSPDHWRDTQFSVNGPAVRWLEACFFENWVEAGGADAGGYDSAGGYDTAGDSGWGGGDFGGGDFGGGDFGGF